MVDFSQLGRQTPEEREADQARERERGYAAEEQKRDLASKKVLTITLAHEPEQRTLPSGDRVMLLRGVQDGRTNPSVAVYTMPSRIRESEDREAAFDQTLRGLGGGDRVSLAGQWSKRGWNNAAGIRQEAWEFKTMAFEKGDVGLERMLENVRADRLGVAPEALPEVGRAQARSPGRAVPTDAGVGR